MRTPRVRFGARQNDVVGRFARELLAARAVAGLTQKEVARRAGVSQPFISYVERGRKHPSLEVMHRLASATGHDLSFRLFPADGVRLRDSGQMRLANQIRRELNAAWRIQLEVPVAPAPDRRAADMVLQTPGEVVQLEIERALLDFQAQLRAAQLKRATLADRLSRQVRLVIALPDTARNRAVVADHRLIVESALPVPSRRIWSSLRSGSPVGGDGLLWIRWSVSTGA